MSQSESSQERDRALGLEALKEIKGLWARYGADPQMAQELRRALSDGVVTESELAGLRARARKMSGPKPRPGAAEAEAQTIKAEFAPGSPEALACDEALKDGVATPAELRELRALLDRSKGQEPAPEPRAKDPRAIPFPTLTMKTPWRKREGENEDSGWGD